LPRLPTIHEETYDDAPGLSDADRPYQTDVFVPREAYAEVVESYTQKVLDSAYAIVKPDGWIIPQETIDVHDITINRASMALADS